MRIHLNHAGASLSSPETLAAIVGHLHAEVTLGPYEAAVAAADAAELLYAEAARLIDASPDEILDASSFVIDALITVVVSGCTSRCS